MNKINFPLGFAAWLVQELSTINFQLIIVLLLVINMPSISQNIDSLENVLKIGSAEDKMNALEKIASYYKNRDPQKALYYANDLLHLSQKEKDKSMEIIAYDHIGGYYFNMVESDSALKYRRKMLEICEEINDEKYTINAKSSLAASLALSTQFDKAIELHQECLDYFIKNGKDYRAAYTYFSIGAIYGDLKLSDLSNEYNFKTLEVLEKMGEKAMNSQLAAVSYINICANYFDKEQYKEAYENIEKGLIILRKLEDTYFIGKALLFRVECQLEFDNPDEALKDMEELEDIAQKLENKYFNKEVFTGKGKIFMKKKQYKQALNCFKQALSNVEPTHQRNKHLIWQNLAQASAYAGTPDETCQYIETYATNAKEFFKEEWSNKMTEMEVKYETAKKELEIDRQNQIITRQIMQRWLLVGGIAVCGIIVVLLWFLLSLRNRRNRELAEANATKDKFFSIISHDLKNPVLAQRDAIKLLVDNANLWNTDTLANFYNELLKSAESEVELIYNLLGWAQIQTGRMSYSPKTILLSDLLPDISLIRKMTENKGVNFIVTMPDSAIITADSNILSTVIRNLLTNAVKFTNQGGTVTLCVSQCKDVVRNASTECYNFSISDTGIGMSKEQIDNIFNHITPHFRSRKGTAGEIGSGLGLIICNDLLEKHGSVLHVESEEGKGSRFWFKV